MTSFPAAARRVRDTDLASHDRLLSLRECVLRFAPYGFRATWHHLVVGAGVPKGLDEDRLSLRRMVDELEQARLIWLARSEDYKARRRREKGAGQRNPHRADQWYSQAGLIAYCPDFEKHPTDWLAVVVQRVIAANESGAGLSATCPACAGTDHGRPLSQLRCGSPRSVRAPPREPSTHRPPMARGVAAQRSMDSTLTDHLPLRSRTRSSAGQCVRQNVRLAA